MTAQRRRAYQIECRYTITSVEVETMDTGQEYVHHASYTNDRLNIEKSYRVDDAVSLTRALQVIDALDQAVTGILPEGAEPA